MKRETKLLIGAAANLVVALFIVVLLTTPRPEAEFPDGGPDGDVLDDIGLDDGVSDVVVDEGHLPPSDDGVMGLSIRVVVEVSNSTVKTP